MNIKLTAKKVIGIHLEPIGDDQSKKATGAKVTLNNEVYSNKKNTNVFRVRYNATIIIEPIVKLDVTYDFDFSSITEIDDDFVRSLEVRSTVPSLAYPYIKNYAEQLLGMSGYGY
ncbi:TPA: hypothetical protein RZF54_004495, partial [Yersinia enterocolitica]|nr:hypothetical protein [Yersinia enterocolitica]